MHEIEILSKQQVANRMIVLETTKPDNFTFDAGQFVQLYFDKAGKPTPRSYSIASAPGAHTLLFLIKIYDDGLASQFFMTECVGKTIQMDGPQGRFTIAPDATSHLFIATGSGMAPIMAILEDELIHKQSTKEMILYLGVRHDTDVFWHAKLDELAAKYENFTCTITLSQPSSDWEGAVGRVTEHLADHHGSHHAYLCGSKPMVIAVRKQLLSYGADPKQIHFEIF